MDSAAGILKQARDSNTQAILPLRGKLLNVEKTDILLALKNETIKMILNTLGCGALSNYEEDDLNYDKIIIVTDADVDGSHIRILLLTIFYRLMPKLIENGHLYATLPPLFRVTVGKEIHYFNTVEEMNTFTKTLKKNSYFITRFKGLVA